MKSLAMYKFNRISPSADFYSKLHVLNKNMLYTTHQCDKILKLLKTLTTDKDLQQQVDKYFEEDGTPIEPERTPPQTDTVYPTDDSVEQDA